mgnify:FL=1
MSNLSELIPAGGGQNNTDFVADGAITSGKPVILNSAGTVSPISVTAGAMGTSGDQGTGNRAGGTSGACYHITNDSTVISFPNSGNSRYATVAVCTLSGTTMTMNTPTVVNSTACAFVRCAYDPTQNCIVVFYKYNGAGNYARVRAATVSGVSFSFGTEANAFANVANGGGEGDISNLNDSSVAICWGSSPTSVVQAMTISGTSLTLGTTQSVSGNTSLPMRMDSGKKGELLCQLGYTSHIQYVACTVSGTTVTAGTVTEIGGGSSTYNDLASGFWNGYTSPESTYIAAYHTPGGAAGVTLGRLITVSGTTLTLNATTSLTADPNNNYPAMGWGSSATQAVFYYRPQSDASIGQVTELNYSGTTISEGATATVGTSNYTNWGVATDQVAKKSIVMYQDGSNSDAAEVNVYSPTSSNLTATNLLGIASAAILDTATGTINTWGSRNEVQTSLTIGSDYYVQSDGTITTASASPAQLIGQAITATQINIKDYTG